MEFEELTDGRKQVKKIIKYHKRYHNLLIGLKNWVYNLGYFWFGIFSLVLTIHVVGRYTGTVSINEAYEFSKYSAIWITFLFAPLLIQDNDHLKIIYFFRKLSLKNKLRLRLFHLSAILTIGVIFSVYGLRYALIDGSFYRSPSMRIPMTYPYMIFPISGVLMSLYTVDEILMTIRFPERLEETSYNFEE